MIKKHPYPRIIFFLLFFINCLSAIGQNADVTNPFIDISSVPTVGSSKNVEYTIHYSFQSLLDTTRGTVKLVKDPKTFFVSAVPAYTSLVGDTLTWNFSTTSPHVDKFIEVTLHIKDTPVVQLVDSIKNVVTLQFNTTDSALLKRTDSLGQLINLICTPASTVNTTLPAPHGLQWLQLFGGSAEEETYGLVAVSDSSFLTTINSSSQDGDAAGSPPDQNGYAVKYLTNGNMVWKKTIGGAGRDFIYSIVKADNGGFILAGTSNSTDGDFSTNHGSTDLLLTKLDSTGHTVWQKLLGGSGYDGDLPLIRKFLDNRYVVLASTSSNDGDVVNPFTDLQYTYPWMLIIDENGNIVSQKVFPITLIGLVVDLQVTLDKCFVIGGANATTDTIPDLFKDNGRIVKIDSAGNILFSKDYANPNRSHAITSLVVEADSTFTFAGFIYPGSRPDTACVGDHGDRDAWVGKTDKNGNLLWQKFYGGSGKDFATSIIKAQGGGYLLTGGSSSHDGNVSGVHGTNGLTDDIWIIKLDDNGELVWQKPIGGDNDEYAYPIIQMPNNEIIVTGETISYNNGDIFGSRGDYDGLIFKIGASNNIRGAVYSDDNGNHIKDSGEPYFTQGIVKSTKGSLVSSSDIVNGFYTNSVDTGAYTTQPVISFSYYTQYPVAGNSTFTNYFQTDSIDFAMMPIPGVNDLKITVLPLTAARPGFATQYKIKYENAGTTTIANGSVRLVKDPRTIFGSASLAYTSLVVDTITWDFSNFAPLQAQEFTLSLGLAIPPTINNGDTLHFYATVNPIAGDTTPVNNIATINQLVTGSYDPNDKTETHGPGFPAQLLANGEYLNYIIRFQNTGTDTAFRVLVKDTLDAKLDWNSLEMISASHPYRLSITDENKLEWKFDPIILPDSTHNFAASNGYIAYRIKPMPTLAEGDSIANRAGIYFDFNLPVLTNTQHTVIDNGMSICPGGTIVYSSGIPGGQAFQWQVNSGSGYTNLINDDIYSGTATDNLQLIAPPSSYSGNQYRCIVSTANGTVTSAVYQLKVVVSWTGAISTAWENPGNWDCGVIPGIDTDVMIKSGTIIVNNNTAIRSLTLKPGVQFWVSAGVSFTVLH